MSRAAKNPLLVATVTGQRFAEADPTDPTTIVSAVRAADAASSATPRVASAAARRPGNLIGRSSQAFDCARKCSAISLPVARHTPAWRQIYSSAASSAPMRCGTPLI